MIGAGASFLSHARNALDFSLDSDILFSVMRLHNKYYVEDNRAAVKFGRRPVRWFEASHAGLEAAITFARDAKSSVKCKVAPCDLSNSPYNWELVWENPDFPVLM